MVSQNVRRLPVVDHEGELAGILSIDDLVRHSTEWHEDGITYSEIVDAMKTMLEGRARSHEHGPAELVAAHT